MSVSSDQRVEQSRESTTDITVHPEMNAYKLILYGTISIL